MSYANIGSANRGKKSNKNKIKKTPPKKKIVKSK